MEKVFSFSRVFKGVSWPPGCRQIIFNPDSRQDHLGSVIDERCLAVKEQKTNRFLARATLDLSVPAKVFYLFSELPSEIRRKIWHLACPAPYLLESCNQKLYTPLLQSIRCKPTSIQDLWKAYKFYKWFWGDDTIYTKSRPTPAVLHACHESRSEYLRENTSDTLIVNPMYTYRLPTTDGRSTYFSWDIDVLLLKTFCRLFHILLIVEIG